MVILDNGHGQNTPGKRSPDGSLLEYEFNRDIVCRLLYMLDETGIDFWELVPELHDVTIHERCSRANKVHEKYPDAYLLSIHANAGEGTGPECFVWENSETKWINPESARLATICANEYISSFPEWKLRKGANGELFKRANYKIQRETTMPSVLTESFFMDHPRDLAFIKSDEGRDRIARMHHDVIVKYEQIRKIK